MFSTVFEVKELLISLEPDIWLTWDLDQNVAFQIDKWFILKNQNWKLSTCDSFPLIVSHLRKFINAIIGKMGAIYFAKYAKKKMSGWNEIHSLITFLMIFLDMYVFYHKIEI